MIKRIPILVLALVPVALWAQFAPAQNQPGTTAMHADSSAFVAWATGCVAEPGPMNITNPNGGNAGTGWPASNVIGYPEGTMGVTCLGDGGMATVTFASPICNREGPDFAVFENGFENAQTPGYWFLELGFVEVSSDGENFFRFPAYSNTQTETQLGGMGCIDPSQIHNLASKYGAMYGTPFDLDEVPDDPLLDKEYITHVRIVDVVGCIDPEYATYDCQGHPVNDPWPTAFASGGMDLDAVGVIHDIEHFPPLPDEPPYIANPVDDVVFDEYPQTIEINLEGVVSDPDDPDENIVYELVSNSNENELSASLNDRLLRLTRLSGEESEAVLVLRATSDGQTIDFEINAILHYVYDGMDEKEMETISVYPNPMCNVLYVGTNNGRFVQCVEVFNVTGQRVISSTETEINVSELGAGVYFVRVTIDDKMIIRRIVKQ
jgi:hypothetical protein